MPKTPETEKCPLCSRVTTVTYKNQPGRYKGKQYRTVLLRPHLNPGGVRCCIAHLRTEEVPGK